MRGAGLPFRVAHHVAGRAVALAEETRRPLEKLTLDEFRSLHPAITDEVFSVLTVSNSVKSRTSFGGAAPAEVRRQIRYWKRRLARS